ncbi:hypothetical protein M3Y95_00364600 [Aphelenchoides besseyi]|nr:hypothetical protein M3Y95_00364600 [Aphelenchoides besseyi]
MTTSNESTSILIVVGEVTEQNCELSAKLNRSPWLIGVALAHVFTSICGLIAMYSYFKTPPIRKAVGLIDTNLKIISAVGFFYCFWGFTSAMFVYLYRLLCMQYWIHVNYPYYNENKYLYDRVYCSSLVYSSAASNRLILSSFINLLALDFTITVADFCLLLYNKKQIAKYYRRITVTYTLAKSFSLRGAQISIGLIYPFSVTHSCSYSTVTLFYVVYLLQSSVNCSNNWSRDESL